MLYRGLTAFEKGGDAYGTFGISDRRADCCYGRHRRATKEDEPAQEDLSKVRASSFLETTGAYELSGKVIAELLSPSTIAVS